MRFFEPWGQQQGGERETGDVRVSEKTRRHQLESSLPSCTNLSFVFRIIQALVQLLNFSVHTCILYRMLWWYLQARMAKLAHQMFWRRRSQELLCTHARELQEISNSTWGLRSEVGVSFNCCFLRIIVLRWNHAATAVIVWRYIWRLRQSTVVF